MKACSDLITKALAFRMERTNSGMNLGFSSEISPFHPFFVTGQ